ncbi:MAG: TIGR01777 family oxidoreductase [Acidobacteria bacterium]|nr:TIGR01777 family oxidoreductase [Acidobacteriota bacterium]
MDILITGATGLIGSKLCTSLLQKNHRLIHMVRKPPVSENRILWDPASGNLDKEGLEGIDAVVHLAGESITGGRWTPEKKRRILQSRIQGTRLLSESLAGLSSPPNVFVSASAIGYYGNRGEERLDESSGPGTGFLPDVCREWEQATEPAAAKGIRVVTLRTGIVISAPGGALAQMLPVFRVGLGGRIGGGRQFMSWIALQDITGIIEFAIRNESLRGPVNAVSPNPVSNREFAKTLGRVLSRPSFLMLPGFAARLAFGEMADALLLASARVSPSRLTDAKYSFRFPTLEEALRNVLRKSNSA